MDIGWFSKSCCGIFESEGDFNVCVFKHIGDFAYVSGGKGEGCPFCVISSICGAVACIIVCYIWCFSLWIRVVRNLLCLQWGGWFALIL